MQQITNWLIDHWLGSAGIGVLIYDAIMRIWPTDKSRSVLKTVFRIIDFVLPNFKKGGGKHPLVIIFLLSATMALFSSPTKAQTWQAFKGVWLNGYANATQAPLPPSGYSALTYFADSLGTYVYDWDSLAWLRIPGQGGGGGGAGLTTADNGLIVNPAGNARQGGSFLPGTTTITLPDNVSLFYDMQDNSSVNLGSSVGLSISKNTLGDFSSVYATNNASTAQANVWVDPELQSGLPAPAGIGMFDGSLNPLSVLFFTPTNWVGSISDNATYAASLTMNENSLNLLRTGSFGGGFSLSSTFADMAHGTGGNSTRFQVRNIDETAVLESTAGSSLTTDLSNVNLVTSLSSASYDLATPTIRAELQSGVDRFVIRNPTVSTGFIRLDVLTNDPEILLGGNATIQTSAGNNFTLKSANNASGANNSGNVVLTTGDVLSGIAGSVIITTGAIGGGTPGNVTLDVNTGELIFTITRTDCTGAPSGAIANVSGVLNICP